MTEKRLFIVAGEASGDTHAACLIRAIVELVHDLRVEGLGGEQMRQAGCELRADLVSSAVMGFVHVAKNIRYFRRLLIETAEHIEKTRPDVVVLVDYPGFNLRLAKAVKKLGIPIVYYISPQIWAWRPRRIQRIAGLVDKMIVILPFEEDIYKNADVDVTYVGHPLLDTISEAVLDAEFPAQIGAPDNQSLIGLLPGSRKQEIAKFLSPLLDTAELLLEKMPKATFLIPCSSQSNVELAKAIIGKKNLPVRVFLGKMYEVAKMSRCCIVVSGTATLEVACFLTPLVVVYKTGHLLWFLARRYLLVDHISLVNILAGREVVPELLQYRMRPELLAEKVLELCRDGESRTKMIEGLRDVRRLLGNPGAAKKAAKVVSQYIKREDEPLVVAAPPPQGLISGDG